MRIVAPRATNGASLVARGSATRIRVGRQINQGGRVRLVDHLEVVALPLDVDRAAAMLSGAFARAPVEVATVRG